MFSAGWVAKNETTNLFLLTNNANYDKCVYNCVQVKEGQYHNYKKLNCELKWIFGITGDGALVL